MQVLVRAGEMKEIDCFSIHEIGIPSVVLMERAALAVTQRVCAYLDGKRRCAGKHLRQEKKERVLVLAGTGNNGADGLAAARMLANRPAEAVVLYLGEEEKATAEWKLQAGILNKLGIPVLRAQTAPAEYTEIEEYDVVIDAVFGIGITRAVEGKRREWLNRINEKGNYVVSVDIPSGLCADTGQALGTAVRADETVTFGYKKLGMALYPGRELCGRVTVAQIGFPAVSVDHASPACFSYEKTDCFLPKRAADGNKATFGRVLVAAGSRNMAGAACFAARAALAAGAGLVRILTAEANREILQTLVPEAILTTWETVPETEELEQIVGWADVLAVGPGLGCTKESHLLLKRILELRRVPTVLDADALNLLAANPDLCTGLDETVVLTPHPGELARLRDKPISDQKEDPAAAAVCAAKQFGCICVCKDAATVTAEPGGKLFINQSGNDGMAAGGSGDVLTGVIAGLLAAGMHPFEAAAAGVYVHGLAGDAAAQKYGRHSMGPLQMTEELAAVFAELERGKD